MLHYRQYSAGLIGRAVATQDVCRVGILHTWGYFSTYAYFVWPVSLIGPTAAECEAVAVVFGVIKKE